MASADPACVRPIVDQTVEIWLSRCSTTLGSTVSLGPDGSGLLAGPGGEFGEFLSLLPPGETPPVAAYIERYVGLCRRRLPQFAAGTTQWWLEPRPFFGGLVRERIWVFWRRVLHTGHHRTQVQAWLRLAGVTPVPAIYGPSGDVTWDEADPMYSLAAANRAAM